MNDDNVFGSSSNNNFGFSQEEQVSPQPQKPVESELVGENAEELARIDAAQRDMQERLRKLREKEEAEMAQKREKKSKAQKELNEWYQSK